MAFGLLPDILLIGLLASTILAGVRRSSGLTLQTQQLVTNGTGVKAVSLCLSAGEWVFEHMVAWAKGSKYFKYDPNVTVAEVRSQVSGFADGIKAATALAGELGAGLGGTKEE